MNARSSFENPFHVARKSEASDDLIRATKKVMGKSGERLARAISLRRQAAKEGGSMSTDAFALSHRENREQSQLDLCKVLFHENRYVIEMSGKLAYYPEKARETLAEFSEEDIKETVRRSFDRLFSSTPMYFSSLWKGQPMSFTPIRNADTCGERRSLDVLLQSDQEANIDYFVRVTLDHCYTERLPTLHLMLYAARHALDFPRWERSEGGDDQCYECSGHGCFECNFTGGY